MLLYATFDIAVPVPKEPNAQPPDQLQYMFSTRVLVEGDLIVTHSSLLVTSISWYQRLLPEVSIPSKPPLFPPLITRLYTSPFEQLSTIRWKAGESINLIS